MAQEDEMFEWFEQDVKDLLEEYENQDTYTDCEEHRRQGAVTALERLLAMWNE
jgi:hypothetical protein